MEWSPEIQISFIPTDHGKIAVVRDDLLNGGTKQRAIIPFIQHMRRGCGIEEFVYASPAAGFAQVALSVSCKMVGVKCTIFRERENISLSEAEKAAQRYIEDKPFAYKIPLGLNEPFYKQCLKQVLETQWEILCDKLGYIPNRLWLPVGSGTLANVFSSIVTDTELMCVDVRVLPGNDTRVQRIRDLPHTQYIAAVESFAQPAEYEPPIPSNLYYDAKLWRFISRNAAPQDVWWNVAS